MFGKIVDNVLLTTAKLYVVSKILAPVSAITWMVAKIVLPKLGFKTVCGIAIIVVSRYAFVAAMSSFSMLAILAVLPIFLAKRAIA